MRQPTIIGTLEIRTASGIPEPVSTVQISFVTVDTLKSKVRDVPSSLRKVNYEMTTHVNDRIISMDIPFIIGIKNEIPPTSEGERGVTRNKLEVAVHSGKSLLQFEFPVVITTYDTLPLYRQFNEPISKVIDSKDTHVMIEYSLPTSAIGPGEELVLNCKTVVNPRYPQLTDKVKLKKVGLQIVEIFDCRCDKAFIKESIISQMAKDFHGQNVGMRGIAESLKIRLPDAHDRYKLFLKQQDKRLLLNDSGVQGSRNDLKPLIIEHQDDPIPYTHHQPMTKRSVLFSTYYELRVCFKFSNAKDVSFVLPITVAPFDRSKSIYLLKWILKESELAESFLKKIESEVGKINYNSRYDSLVYPQRKPIKMVSKDDKQRFV